MNISIYGYRHHAFVTAVCLGALKRNITFYDPNNLVNQKVKSHDFEFSLPDLWNSHIQSKQIVLSKSVPITDDHIHWVFINEASIDSDTGNMYLNTILSANPDAKIIISGLVPIGYCNRLISTYKHNYPNLDKNIAYIPFLRLREGSSIKDFFNHDVFIVGHNNLRFMKELNNLLSRIHQDTDSFQYVSITEAELIRASINSLLATRLSFINEIALLAERYDVDITSISKTMEKDSRIGQGYLTAGCGFGGKTFPAELGFLSTEFDKNSAANHLFDSVSQINTQQKEILFQKLWRYFKTNIEGIRVAIWGGAYKKGTARTTNSPVHTLLEALWAQGIETVVFDPDAQKNLSDEYNNQALFSTNDDPYACISDCDALLITGWNSNELPDFSRVKELMKTPVIFDGRNLFNIQELEGLGIEYFGIGYGRSI